MNYSKFFTPPIIADLLISQLEIQEPFSVIDICCGSCNLLFAAKKKWKMVRLFGVDIEQHTPDCVDFIQMDGRKYSIDHEKQFSLVLANPPFDSVSEKGQFIELYNDISMNVASSRLEIEMLFANLRLLTRNGTLLIIMPSTFINSEKNIKYRKYLAHNYFVHKIIHLPEETFGSTKINSYALIISNKLYLQKNSNYYSVYYHNKEYIISQPISIEQSRIENGEWDINAFSCSPQYKLNIKRGNISSHSFRNEGEPVLHTSKASSNWQPSVRYTSYNNPKAVFANNDDIIVSRIGKSAGQWCKYSGEKIMISDCLFRIIDPEGEIARRLDGKLYSQPLKGVATRYITINDFTSWYDSL